LDSTPGEICAGDPCEWEPATFTNPSQTTPPPANPLSFTRYYNSLASNTDPYATELGSRWRNNYDRYLLSSHISDGRTRRRAGADLTNTGGVWSSDSDVDYTLTNTGLTWTLTDHNDTVETYTQSISGEGN